MLLLQLVFIIFCFNAPVLTTNSSEFDAIEEEASPSLCQLAEEDGDTEFWMFQEVPEGNCTHFGNNSETVNMTCNGGLKNSWYYEPNFSVHRLIIRGWPLECFPPTLIFHLFPTLEDLSIENSNFTYFFDDFPASAKHLKHLRLSGFSNLTLKNSLLSHLPVLETFDVRGNNLETLDSELISSPPNLQTVQIYDNKWNCSHSDMKWFSELSSASMITAFQRIVDYKNLTCQGKMFKGKPLHVVMELLKSLRLECPPTCSCYLTNLVRPPGWDSLVPVTTADCRWRGLTELPAHVPAITTILLLHGNKISSVAPLAQNPTFRRVADVYLDYNRVTSLRPLEGADWMLYFRVLSLKGNNITQLPTHAFDNAFQQNQNIGRVYLGHNPWRCDCHFTPAFRELLLRHQHILPDLPNITCAQSDNKEISNARIQTLSRSAICRQSGELLQPLDILNVILSCLIIFVLGKFVYDYYCFKKTGQLPWIVTKLP